MKMLVKTLVKAVNISAVFLYLLFVIFTFEVSLGWVYGVFVATSCLMGVFIVTDVLKMVLL